MALVQQSVQCHVHTLDTSKIFTLTTSKILRILFQLFSLPTNTFALSLLSEVYTSKVFTVHHDKTRLYTSNLLLAINSKLFSVFQRKTIE